MNASILVIDDSATARSFVLDTLRETGLFSKYYQAANGREGLERLRRNTVDVVLCDLEMPGMDGLEFLKALSEDESIADIPVIMLTGHEDERDKIRGLEMGASDYVTKPFSTGELLARVKVHLKIKMLQDSLKEKNRLLEEISMTDHLTGLSNRRHFMSTLEREFTRSRRTGLPLSLIMFDVDYFKKVNDTYGHQQGDRVLATVADLLARHMRPYDLAARYGGEEFSLMFPETELTEAVQIAERLRQETAGLTFSGTAAELKLTASLGVASIPEDRIDTMEHLIREADAALYRAKNSGRNRVESILP